MLYWCEMGISNESLVRKARRKTYAQKYIHKFLSLKLAFAIFYQIFVFSPNDSPLKTVKNVFYLI